MICGATANSTSTASSKPVTIYLIAARAYIDWSTARFGLKISSKNMLQAIERSITAANIGINPQNDGVIIRLYLPPLTEERRKELVKKCNAEGENAKVSIRSIRRDAIENIKKLQKSGLSEDAAKDATIHMESA